MEIAYRLQFYDLWGTKWTALLYLPDYDSDIVELQGSEEAIVFEFQTNNDGVFAPLQSSRVILNVVCDEHFKFDQLYSAENMYVWVEVFQGDEDSSEGIPYWTGWVDPKSYEEPYEPTTYVVSIVCIDGLELLSDILFTEVDSSGGSEAYTDRRYISQILLDVLDKIGYSEFKEFVNLYEESILSSVDDSPFDQTMIDTDLWKNDIYCDRVLTDILEAFNARITQINGVFCIYRPVELKDSLVYGRYFTGVSTKTSISISPDQYINRDDHNTILKQVPGGVKTMRDPLTIVKMRQDYGNKDSWIENHNLIAESWDGADFKYWSRGGDIIICPCGDLVPGEPEGVFIKGKYNEVLESLYQEFTTHALVSETDAFKIEFDYTYYNDTGSPQNVTAYVQIYSPGGYWDREYLGCDGGELVNANWETIVGNAYLILNYTANEDLPGWTHFERQVVGIPKDGNYSIRIIGNVDADGVDIWFGIKNIRFYATSTKVSKKMLTRKFLQRIQITAGNRHHIEFLSRNYIVSQIELEENTVEYTHEKQNDISAGSILEISRVLGDVPKTSDPVSDADTDLDNRLEQFAGALSCLHGQNLSEVAATFVINYAATYAVGGVIVTSNGDDIIFTSDTAGVDFTGSTTITNLTGNLSGSVAYTQENVSLQPAWDSGTTYSVYDQCSYDGVNYICIEGHTNQQPPNETYWAESAQPQVRIDTITLTGSSGTADILCDENTCEAEVSTTRIPTEKWWSRLEESSDAQSSGSLYSPLLELMIDEIAQEHSRPAQLLFLKLQELYGYGESILNRIGNIQDTKSFIGAGSNLMTDPDGTSETYDTFTVDGVSISSAICASAGLAYSNTFSVTEGEIIQVEVSLTLNSGQLPGICIGVDITSVFTDVVQLAAGINKVGFTITSSHASAKFIIINSEAANWSMGDITISRTIPRKYVINRGTFNVRSRNWDLDLIEIIE